MSRATEVSAVVFSGRVNEAVYTIVGHHAHGDGGATPTTKHIEDHLRAKGYQSGREFRWMSPFKLQVQDSALDRDLLDSIQAAGASGQDDDSDEDV